MAPKNLILALLLAVTAAAQTPQRAVVVNPTTGAPIWPPASTLRLQLGGTQKGFADLAAAQAATADYAGQVLTSADGWLSMEKSGTVHDIFWIQDANTLTFAQTTLNAPNGRILSKGITSTGASEHLLAVTTGDNVLTIQNLDDEFHSAINFLQNLGVNDGPGAAIGLGNPALGLPHYQNRYYIASNPKGSDVTVSPPDILIAQEQDNGSGMISHFRLMFDGTNKDIEFYGWNNASTTGDLALHINSAGKTGVGTSTLTANAQMTVSGAVASAQQRWHATKAGGAAQTLAAATWTDIAYSSEVADVGGIFASNQATPTMPGVVHINAMVYFGNLSAGEGAEVRLLKDGALVCSANHTGSGADNHTISFSFTTTTNGANVFKLQAQTSGGGDIGGETHFQGWVQ